MIKNYLKEMIHKIKYVDKLMLFLVFILIGIGVLMIYSITSISMYNGAEDDSLHFVKKTVMAIAIGGTGLLILASVPFKTLKFFGFLALIICPPLLVFTLMFGSGPKGSPVRSWIDLGFLSIQPAEFVKVGIILAMSWAVTKSIQHKRYDMKKWRIKSKEDFFYSFFGILAYVVTNILLICAQPDMGTGIIIFGIAGIMFVSSGISLQTIGKLTGLGALIVSPLLFFIKPYQIERFAIWLDPFNHDYGLQNVMGYTAIALGGLTGVGIGKSTQKYGYVIEPHNDFIVTILAEELGVVIVLLIMGIYFFIAMRCFFTGLKCDDRFGSLVCIGVGALFLVQPVINLGGASGFIPLTGVTLPFISYGGSSMMTFLLAIGVYLNVRAHNKIQCEEPNK